MNLYRVVVTQEWRAEAEALVWAPDRRTAGKLAAEKLKPNLDAAKALAPVAIAHPEPIQDDAVLDRMDDDDLWLLMPDGKVCDNSLTGLARFKELLPPERLEALRRAQIEAGNGQLHLMGVAP